MRTSRAALMAGRRSRKRRASQVFPENETNDQEVPQQPETELEESIEDGPDRLEKEQQIWDTIREEHFEGKFNLFPSTSSDYLSFSSGRADAINST